MVVAQQLLFDDPVADARSNKQRFAQFFTPAPIAAWMAQRFPPPQHPIHLLDAGAGHGALSAAWLQQWLPHLAPDAPIHVSAYECDATLHPTLRDRLAASAAHPHPLAVHLSDADFIEAAVALVCTGQRPFTHAILNPPYQKITRNSRHRRVLRDVGIETVNLYAAFVALSVLLLAPHGHAVAIIPRSFCNGPYFRPFRDLVLRHAAIRAIHLFATRNTAFKADDVLQENVIIHLERDAHAEPVTISTATDASMADLQIWQVPWAQIVAPDDPEQVIHIPTAPQQPAIDLPLSCRQSLSAIGVQVSTGPVVDFRLKPYLRPHPEAQSLPLLYPAHFSGLRTRWPLPDAKKPNAIMRHPHTEPWLYPNGHYCVVRRFSAKEEPRRVVASVITPDTFPEAPLIGVENHLNLFHSQRHGLSAELAYGLAAYLNTSSIDRAFRQFSGHTQVNVADLKRLTYPDRERLIQLGTWAMAQQDATTAQFDAWLEELTR